MSEPVSETSGGVRWLPGAGSPAPLIVAHRGASGAAPENTLAAFRLALEQGAPAVECDVHLSADGVPVVLHDDTIDRTTDGTGPVDRLPLAAIRRLDAGSWHDPRFAGEPIPTLAETLEVCRGRAWLFVELKRGGGAALVDATLAAIAESVETRDEGPGGGAAAGPGARVAVISFDREAVRLVAERRPELPLGLLLGPAEADRLGPEGMVREAAALGAGAVAPHYSAASEALVAAAHRAGLAVSVWTVDDPGAMRALTALGVDGLTTNRPDVALLECRPS